MQVCPIDFNETSHFIGFFVTMFSVAYLISPRFCHRFVGYLEEEAVKTYTKCLQVSFCSFLFYFMSRQRSMDVNEILRAYHFYSVY